MNFVRTLQKITQFPTTRRTPSFKLKTLLLAITNEAHRSEAAALEAKAVCEAFLSQFQEDVAPVVVEVPNVEPEPSPELVDTAGAVAYTQEQLEDMHYTAVDKIAVDLDVSTEGNKAETIVAILSVQA